MEKSRHAIADRLIELSELSLKSGPAEVAVENAIWALTEAAKVLGYTE